MNLHCCYLLHSWIYFLHNILFVVLYSIDFFINVHVIYDLCFCLQDMYRSEFEKVVHRGDTTAAQFFCWFMGSAHPFDSSCLQTFVNNWDVLHSQIRVYKTYQSQILHHHQMAYLQLSRHITIDSTGSPRLKLPRLI